jgi:hypothetical protein
MEETKICSKCAGEKPLTEFQKDTSHSDGYRCECKLCSHISKKLHYNPEAQRSTNLKANYKINLERFNTLFKLQGYKCAACGSTDSLSKKGWCVDHDHSCCYGVKSCGKCIRAILCTSCNKTLGDSYENKHRLKALIKYLEKHDKHS